MPLWFKRSEQPGSGFVRIIQAADFHGSTAAWRKFMAAAKQHQAQHAIVSGDLTGKAIVPKDEIDERQKGKSSMPEDVLKYLSKRELRDLVEFLSGLK